MGLEQEDYDPARERGAIKKGGEGGAPNPRWAEGRRPLGKRGEQGEGGTHSWSLGSGQSARS